MQPLGVKILIPSQSYLSPSAPLFMVGELGGIFGQNSESSLLTELPSELGTVGQHWSHLWEFGRICFCDLQLWPSHLTAAPFPRKLKTLLYCFQLLPSAAGLSGHLQLPLWAANGSNVAVTALVTGPTGSLDSCFPWSSVGLWDILVPVHSIQKSKTS